MGLYRSTGRLINRSGNTLFGRPGNIGLCYSTLYSIGTQTLHASPNDTLGRICSPFASNHNLLCRSSNGCMLAGKCMNLPSKSPRAAARYLSSWVWNRPRLFAPSDHDKDQHSTPSKDDGFSSNYSQNGNITGPPLIPQKDLSCTTSTNDVSPQFWSHRLFKSQTGDDVVVHYCQTLESTERVAQLFLNDTVLGFDMEWQPEATSSDKIQNNVSLIQLAGRDRIALFQIALFSPGETIKDLVAPTLKRILESPDITKTGVAVKSDSTRLRTHLGINPRGIFELSHLYRLVKYYNTPSLINKKLVGMSKQVDEHFGVPLRKDPFVRCSNWSSPLTEDQIHYAAADAYAGYQLFCIMDAKRKAMSPTPPLPAHAELNLPIRMYSKKTTSKDPVDVKSRGVAPCFVPRRYEREVSVMPKSTPRLSLALTPSIAKRRTGARISRATR
ncbi:ribonuclease H-like domain-containing protein [Aspergillus pseudodeflectus]|uniref:Ribonuclease H-like domain-containing protein n=1 Tax=Aspergillus pseudodeflectus TaxID=176178 RepID=A0ABR4L2J0_9EURO